MGMLNWMLELWSGEQDEVAPADETTEEKTKREQRAADRVVKRQEKADKAQKKRDFRIEKIKALTSKALAVGIKRKWLVFLIGIALVAYFVISSGGLGGLGGLLDKVKGFFN